jgi:acetolactate synthase-1/2/3 large subunit
MPDMKRIAAVYGFSVFCAQNHSELDEAIRKTLTAPGPAFCELRGDPREKLGPKTASFKRADGTMVSRPLEDLAPFLSRDEFRANMIIDPVGDS